MKTLEEKISRITKRTKLVCVSILIALFTFSSTGAYAAVEIMELVIRATVVNDEENDGNEEEEETTEPNYTLYQFPGTSAYFMLPYYKL